MRHWYYGTEGGLPCSDSRINPQMAQMTQIFTSLSGEKPCNFGVKFKKTPESS